MMPIAEKPKILIIDDQKVNLETLEQLLHSDYAIMTATDGDEGIRMALAKNPDLILLDLAMPDPNGYTVLKELKESAQTMHMPVIIFSGNDDIDAEEKSLLFGAADYLSKPLRPIVVKARIRTQIDNVRLRSEVARLDLSDMLTGIANLRSFEVRMKIEWAHAVREQLPLSLLFIDVDGFREYNDQFGHPQGDELLKEVARTLDGTIKRASDLVARIRGKLFGVLLWNTDEEAARVVASRVQDSIAEMVVPTISGTWTATTVSIGLAARVPEPGEKVDLLAKKALGNLSSARDRGGNRLVVE
ncbi:MAG: diguanylate cyclase [Coriobacteriales bacterium]|jgi:diguanylate cyclase (GGDEF)-like protein|nr:diguanylate cyclase [Coriobacteriales bacterium]